MSSVRLNSGGPYTNTGVIDGYAYGIAFYGGAGMLTNSGTISASSPNGIGVALHAGGTVTNLTGGYVYGYSGGVWVNGTGSVANGSGATIDSVGGSGVYIGGALASVTNAGEIQAIGGPAVLLANGGSVSNAQGGTISGGAYGILIESAAGTITNAGGIYGVAGALGGKSIAIEFTGSGANSLTLQTGSVLGGAVIGSTAIGAANALILQGAGQAFNDFYNFDTLSVDASATWTLGGISTIGVTNLTSGTLAILGGLTTALTQSAGTVLTIGMNGELTLTGASTLAGTLGGVGALDLTGGATTIDAGAEISVGAWSILGWAETVTLDSALTYSSVFDLGPGSVFVLLGGAFTLTGLDTFAGGKLVGAYQLDAEGTTEVSGLTIGGTVNFDNFGRLNQTGNLILGDLSNAAATLTNSASGIFDFLDDSGIGCGASTASSIANAGLLEKTGGTGTSTIAACLTGAGEILIRTGILSLVGADDVLSGLIAGLGALDFAAGAATLSSGASIWVVDLSETGAGTSLTIATNLRYAGAFTQGAGAEFIVNAGDTLRFAGTASFAGLASGAGTLSVISGTTILRTGATIATSFWTVAGAGTILTLVETLSFSGGFSEGAGATLNVGGGDTLTLAGTNSLSGSIGGAGTMALTSGATTAQGGATIGAAFWQVSGAVTTLTLDGALTYAGRFAVNDGALIDLAMGALTLTGAATISDVEVSGAYRLVTKGATSVAGLTIGGSVYLVNSGVLRQSGDVMLGDLSNSTAWISNNGSYDLINDSGVSLGAAAVSGISNAGVFEKTGGAGTSTIAARLIGPGEILVASGTLALTGFNDDLAGQIAGAGVFSVAGGSTVLEGGAAASVAKFLETGVGTTLWIATMLSYAGAFTQSAGAELIVEAGEGLSLGGTNSLAGLTRGLGTLSLTSGETTVQVGATIVTSFWNVSGAGTNLTIAAILDYSGAFTQGAGVVLILPAGDGLTLGGTNSLAGVARGLGTLSVTSGTTTLLAGAKISTAFWSVTGAKTTLTLDEVLTYVGGFTEGAGAELNAGAGDTLILAGTSMIGGAIGGAGTLSLTSGATTVQSGATIGAAFWSVTGTKTTLTLGEVLRYSGSFSEGDGANFNIGAGDKLILAGTSTLGGAIGGAGTLTLLSGATTVQAGATMGAAFWNVFGAGTSLTIATILNYAGAFTQGAGAEVLVSAGDVFAVAGTASFAGSIGGAGVLSEISGAATLQAGATIATAFWRVIGALTKLTLDETLLYSGGFTEGAGAELSASAGDTLTLAGTSSLSGSIGGAGTLSLTSGVTTVGDGAAIGVAFWNVSGAGTILTLDTALTFAGSFAASDQALIDLTTDALTLTGPGTFSDVEVSGAASVITFGSTVLEGLDLAGASRLYNHGTVTQSGAVTVGDANASDKSVIANFAGAIWRIEDGDVITLGADHASYLGNAGLFEKTTGSGVSTVALAVGNNGSIWVGSGTLDFQGAVAGQGGDTISGAATLEFDNSVSALQSVDFLGADGVLILGAPLEFDGHISGFDTAGAGSKDSVQLGGAWTLDGFVENASGTGGTLNLTSGASHLGLYFVGAYGDGLFSASSGKGGGTLITYA